MKALKSLKKVVQRGGAMGVILGIFLEPVVLESAECPAGPGTCRVVDDQKDEKTPDDPTSNEGRKDH
jgi:hypothetical protein